MKPSRIAAFLAVLVGVAALLSGDVPVLRAQNPPDFSGLLKAAAATYKKSAAGSADRSTVETDCGTVISALGASANLVGPQLQQLLTAFELRARVRVANGETDPAREDFRSLLMRQPDYEVGTLTVVDGGPLSAQAEELFGEVKKATIGRLILTVSPADAELTSNIALPKDRAAGVPIQLPLGNYSLTGRKAMYAPAEVTFEIKPGEPTPVDLTLTRVRSAIGIVTVPAGVQVFLDGVRKGETAAVSIPQPYRNSQDVASMPVGAGFLEITDVPDGNPNLRFTMGCYEEHTRPFPIARPGDYPLPVRLNDASAELKVSGTSGTVYIDNVKAGTVPFTGKLCRGSDKKVVEVRSGARGRQIVRLDPMPRQVIEIPADPKPAIAILAQTGVQGNILTDFRLRVEEDVQQADRGQSIALFGVPRDVAQREMEAEGLQTGWLSRPESEAGRHLNAAALLRASKNLSRKLEVQGVAEIHFPDFAGDAKRVELTYLAEGSAVPEKITFSLDDPRGTRQALAKINRPYRVMRPSSGLVTADVESVAGALVLRQAWNLTKGVAPTRGDVVLSVDGTKVASATDFDALVASRKKGDVLGLQVKAPNGDIRQVQLTVDEFPVAVWYDDEMLQVNKLLLDFRLAAGEAPPEHQMSARLNLAIVLMKAKNWTDALAELEKVQLRDLNGGFGISRGTVQYYMGLCLEEADRTADAIRAYNAAIQSPGAWLKEGTLVEPLARARLALLNRK